MPRAVRWQALLVALMYGLVICGPAIKLSLWLDEILQLMTTSSKHVGLIPLLNEIADNAGSAPLGYLLQAASIRVFGLSNLAARLSSIIPAVFACYGVGLLALKARVRSPLIAILFFCFLPIEFRYATEARPYELALFCSIWSIVFFLRIVEKPTLTVCCLYALAAGLAIYSQPFSYFVVLAQLIWLIIFSSRYGFKIVQMASVSSFAVAASFAPWFFFARQRWQHAIATTEVTKLDIHVVLVILREISGAGYFGSLVLLFLVILGLRSSTHSIATRLFWLSGLAVPLTLVLLTDAYFGYFFAIRQLLFIFPAIVILAMFGLEDLHCKSRLSQAADAIQAALYPNGCYMAVPNDANTLFEFFEPQLSHRRCPELASAQLAEFNEIILAISPYSTTAELPLSIHALSNIGLAPNHRFIASKPNVQVWNRNRQIPVIFH